MAENVRVFCGPLPDNLPLGNCQVVVRPDEVTEELLHVLGGTQH